jgi:hypothetical protein
MKKHIQLLALSASIILALGCSTINQLPFLSTPTPVATSTPVPTATPVRQPPKLYKIELNEYMQDGQQNFEILITYRDPDGDATSVHYEVVETTNSDINVEDGTIEDAPDVQKAGAGLTGNWNCGDGNYTVTLEITLLDRAGNTSNPEQVTISCDPLSAFPSYSDVLATYPAGTNLCGSDVDIIGMDGDKLQLTIRMLAMVNGDFTIRCYGTKVTATVGVTLDGEFYEAGSLLTVDADLNWIRVSGWD